MDEPPPGGQPLDMQAVAYPREAGRRWSYEEIWFDRSKIL